MPTGFERGTRASSCFPLRAKSLVRERPFPTFAGSVGIRLICAFSRKGASDREGGEQKGMSGVRHGIEQGQRVVSGLCAASRPKTGEWLVYNQRGSFGVRASVRTLPGS